MAVVDGRNMSCMWLTIECQNVRTFTVLYWSGNHRIRWLLVHDRKLVPKFVNKFYYCQERLLGRQIKIFILCRLCCSCCCCCCRRRRRCSCFCCCCRRRRCSCFCCRRCRRRRRRCCCYYKPSSRNLLFNLFTCLAWRLNCGLEMADLTFLHYEGILIGMVGRFTAAWL